MKMVLMLAILLICLNANENKSKIDIAFINHLFYIYKNEIYKHDEEIIEGEGKYYCIFLKETKNEYCIRDDKKILINRSIISLPQNYIKVYDYKTGKILQEGFEDREKGLIGLWKIYDYHSKKIKYIDFDKKINIEKIIKWIKSEDPHWRKEFMRNVILNNKRALRIDTTSLIIYVNPKTNKVIKYELYYPDRTQEKYKCLYNELKKETKIYKIGEKCDLVEVGFSTEEEIK